MDRLTLILLLVIAVILITRSDYLSIGSQTQLSKLLGAPSNAKVNIEAALGVLINQGQQAVELTSSDITVKLAGSPFMILQGTSGNVGIGTTLPSQKLHINPGKVLLQGSTAAVYFNDTNRGIIYSKIPGGAQSFTSNSPKDGLALYGYLDGCLGTTDIANGGAKSILSWASTGTVAINPITGTLTPYPLAVYGSTSVERGTSYIYLNDVSSTGLFKASIYAQYGIISGAYGFMNLSDQRIKKNIKICENALATIEQIDVVSYEHIDHTKERRVEYGVVAQQLQQHVPSSVNQITECVPNVYQRVEKYIQGPTTTHLFFQNRVPEIEGGVLKIVGEDKEVYVRILDKGTHSFVVEKFELEGKLFAYGTQESDFLVVDKLQLGILALQGVKELLSEVKRLRALIEK